VAEPIALDTWSAKGVRLSDVINALSDLRDQTHDRGSARTAVMTLVAVAPGDDQAYAATNVLRSLGGHHPARIVILRPDPDQVAELDARATLYSMQADDHRINFEEVILSIQGQAAHHLDSFVEAFTVSDLPVAVWYVSAIPDPTDPLLSVASAVLLDSRDAEDAGELRSLLGLARRRTVVDLSWIRLGPWRELLAGMFEAPSNRSWLNAVESAEVTGKSGPRRLLGGWLSGQLGLLPGQVSLVDARHVEIRLRCGRNGETATFSVERGDQHRTVTAEAVLPSGPTERQVVPLADEPLGVALATGLTHLRPDPVWEKALSSANLLSA
jgi:glucose-6-phosphate dehydrogenase assembly protein OpcA